MTGPGYRCQRTSTGDYRHFVVGKRWSACIAIMLLQFASLSGSHAAAPFLPINDEEVLETLPRALIDSRQELTSLQNDFKNDPSNVALASKVAAQFLNIGNAEGDPRYFGFAQSALRLWWEKEDAPPRVLRLRAKLKEKEHRYADAAEDVVRLLQHKPRDAQAWIDLSNLYRVQGKYSEAQSACDRLSEFAGSVPVIMCSVPLMAVTGRAEEAYDRLARIPPSAKKIIPEAYQWVLTMRAEIARILGRVEMAESHFREGLSNNPSHSYTLRSYADFLIDRGRATEALELTRHHTGGNGLLLRAAIAARRAGEDSMADAWQSQLADRFAEIRLRGSDPHGRFEARFYLELDEDSQESLSIALANWQQQKESRDTRIVLEAAIAAGDTQAAQPALEFLRDNNSEDVELRSLMRQLEADGQ